MQVQGDPAHGPAVDRHCLGLRKPLSHCVLEPSIILPSAPWTGQAGGLVQSLAPLLWAVGPDRVLALSGPLGDEGEPSLPRVPSGPPVPSRHHVPWGSSGLWQLAALPFDCFKDKIPAGAGEGSPVLLPLPRPWWPARWGSGQSLAVQAAGGSAPGRSPRPRHLASSSASGRLASYARSLPWSQRIWSGQRHL